MKIFGSITELVATVFRKNSQAITLRPNQATTYSASRDIQTPPQDANSILVSESATQTLTNKTLTSPVINTPTGITKSDVGLGNVDNTSDATKNSATATLTNKTLTAPVINSPTGITKSDVGLSNVDNTSDASKNSASVVLTNKDIDGGTASNTDRITLPKASGATLAGLTRKQATLVYDTTSNLVNFDNGTVLAALAAAVDASPTQSGQVNTSLQSFAGLKIFQGGVGDVIATDNASTSITLTNSDRRQQVFFAGSPTTVTIDGTGMKAGTMFRFHNSQNSSLQVKAGDASNLSYAAMLSNGSVSSARLEKFGTIELEALVDAPATNTDWRVLSVREHGAWTPTLVNWGGSTGTMYSRIDNMVYIKGQFTATTVSGLTTTLLQNTLPHSTSFVSTADLSGAASVLPDTNSNGPALSVNAIYSGFGVDPNVMVTIIYNGNATSTLIDAFNFTATYDLGAAGY